MAELRCWETSIDFRQYTMGWTGDKRWPRVKLAYDAIKDGVGPKYRDYEQVIAESYEKEIYDEFVEPSVIIDEAR